LIEAIISGEQSSTQPVMNDKQSKQEKPASLLTSWLRNSEIPEVASELAEVSLDTFIDDEIIKDIPILGVSFKIIHSVKGIREKIFEHKLKLFLNEFSNLKKEEIENFRDRLKKDPQFEKRAGETIILLLERHERFEKSVILGKFFHQLIIGKCSHELFLRLSASLDRITIEDLESFYENFSSINDIPEPTKQGLYRSGLLDFSIKAGVNIHGPHLFGVVDNVEVKMDYKISDLGFSFMNFAFNQ